MVLAALDFGNDRRIVTITGQRVAQAQKRAVRRCQHGAVVFGIAAKLAHLRLKRGDDGLALVGAAQKDVAKLCRIGFFGSLAIAIDAVERGGDQRIERADILVVKHLKSFRENSGASIMRCLTHPTSADP